MRQLPETVRERGDEGELVREAVENVPAPPHGAAVRDVEGVAERGQSRLYRPVEPPLHGSGGTNSQAGAIVPVGGGTEVVIQKEEG